MAPAAPPPPPKPVAERPAAPEAQVQDEQSEFKSWDDKYGQAGVVLVAVAACALAWAVMTYLL
jgi:hypothetical protein